MSRARLVADLTGSKTNWDTAYADRNNWDGGATGLNAATGRTSLGATTAGASVLTLVNPGAVSYLKFAANNTASAVSTATVKTDIGLGNVENTALSSWAGSTNITTLGTVTTVTSPTAAGSSGVRKITISTSAPSGGSDGDVWLTYA